MMVRRTALAAVVCVCAAASSYAQWTPPVGIPDPGFGINVATPAPTRGAATFPATVAAGEAVQLQNVIGGGVVTCTGTATSPAFILGGSATLTGDFRILGSYCVLDGWHLTGSHIVELAGDHLTFRNSTSVGIKTEGPSVAVLATGSHIVIYHNTVTDHGDVNATDDQDAHCISAGRGSSAVWIVDNETARCSGDGINANPYPYDTGGYTAINGVFIGRNRSHDNKQTGVWAKQSQDIVVSQNEVWGHHAGNSSYGQGIGYQYGTQYWWAVYNNLHDNDLGIGISGDLGTEPGPRSAFAIGNVITNAPGDPGCVTGDVWGCTSFLISGGASYYVLNTTFQNVVDGIHATRDAGLWVSGSVGSANVVTDGPVLPATTITPQQLFDAYKARYGADISTGSAPPTTGTSSVPPPPPPPPQLTWWQKLLLLLGLLK